MELTIKNDKLIAHFAAEQEMKAKKTGEISDPVYGAWTVEHPETMLFGFLDSFLEICEASKIEFDLTYSTIKNLGAGLVALYHVQKNSYNQATNTEIVAKTLAAVLSYVAINEHGCWFRTTSYLEQYKAGKAPKQSLWADVMEIAVGRKNKYKDLRTAAMASVAAGSVMSPNGISLVLAPVVEEYKKLTGVDIMEHGVTNMFAN